MYATQAFCECKFSLSIVRNEQIASVEYNVMHGARLELVGNKFDVHQSFVILQAPRQNWHTGESRIINRPLSASHARDSLRQWPRPLWCVTFVQRTVCVDILMMIRVTQNLRCHILFEQCFAK